LDEIVEEVEEEVVEEVVETVPFAYTEVLGMTVGETTWNEGIEALKRFIRYIDSEDETIRFEGKYQWGNAFAGREQYLAGNSRSGGNQPEGDGSD
jgi:hypothetical protein